MRAMVRAGAGLLLLAGLCVPATAARLQGALPHEALPHEALQQANADAGRAAAANAAAAAQEVGDDDRRILMLLRVPAAHYRPDLAYGGGYQSPPGAQARRRLARQLAQAHGLRLVEGWPMPALGLDCFVLEAPSVDARARELPRLLADPRVESAQPVQRFHLLSVGGGDPLAQAQPAVRAWRLQELHRLSTGRGVLVASIDSGIDTRHPDLRGQDIATRNFIDGQAYRAEAHGTSVGGIIVARPDNGAGIVGIAPGAALLALRACAQTGAGGATCDSFGLAKALQFALDARARVVNLSLTGPQDPLLARLIDVALERGAVVVGAADPASDAVGFPASHAGVLAVTGSDDPRPRDPGVLKVPDRGIPAPVPGGGWDLVSGSSYATAQLSGLVALAWQFSPRTSGTRMRAAFSPGPGLGLPAQRPGNVDACEVFERVAARCACSCASADASRGRPRR